MKFLLCIVTEYFFLYVCPKSYLEQYEKIFHMKTMVQIRYDPLLLYVIWDHKNSKEERIVPTEKFQKISTILSSENHRSFFQK